MAAMAMIAGVALSAVGTIAQMGASSEAADAQRQQADAIRMQSEEIRQQADTERQVAEYNAKQSEITGQEERASAQRQAFEKTRQTNLVQSRLQAVSAGAGGGASDPTVVSLASDIEGMGAYQSLFSMYQGDARARAYDDNATLSRYSGGRKADALMTDASANDIKANAADTAASATEDAGFATALGSFGSLFSKFSPKFA